MNPLPPQIVTLQRTLRSISGAFADELELQDAIGARLSESQQAFEREVRLSSTHRVDFLAGGVGIEVKIKGSLSEVTRQLHAYARYDQIQGLLLVTTRMQHRPVQRELLGKPVGVVILYGSIL